MTENKDLRKPVYVEKADMAVSDLTSGGVLVAEQRDRFLLVNIKGTAVTEKISVIKMSRAQLEIPKMTTFGSRVWHAATEATALPFAQRVAPGFGKTTLTTHEIIAEVDYPRYVLQAQVEGPQFHNTLIAYLGMHTRRDWEDLIINGDTASADDFLALFEGMLDDCTTNTYDAGGVALDSSVLKATMNTMPSEFRGQTNLGFLTNEIAWSAYDDELMARGTQLGDAHQTQETFPALPFKGLSVVGVPLFPDSLGVGGNETEMLYGNPKNFVFGVEENVELQTEYNIKTRVWTVVVTARVDGAYEHEALTVRAYGILGA